MVAPVDVVDLISVSIQGTRCISNTVNVVVFDFVSMSTRMMPVRSFTCSTITNHNQSLNSRTTFWRFFFIVLKFVALAVLGNIQSSIVVTHFQDDVSTRSVRSTRRATSRPRDTLKMAYMESWQVFPLYFHREKSISVIQWATRRKKNWRVCLTASVVGYRWWKPSSVNVLFSDTKHHFQSVYYYYSLR